MTMTSKLPVHLGDLPGGAGNAFAILGAVRSSAKQMAKVGVDFDYKSITDKMREGDYEHLLDVVLEFCDDLDGSIEALRNGSNDDESDEEF